MWLTNIVRQMADHMRQSQKEMNELIAEYWKLRHATGMLTSHLCYAHTCPPDTAFMTEFYMETLANKLGMQVTST